MKKFVIIIVLCFFCNWVVGQQATNANHLNKGNVYIMWGWNRAAYSKSNIKFTGNDYDFKLYKVKAHDRPTKVSFHNYLQPNRITIPQTNFRVGYFIKNNIAVSLGFDHMKYVMDQNQTVKMVGTITQEGTHKGTYNGDKTLTTDFLEYEHTDGLNYINVEVEKYFSIYQAKNSNCKIDILGGAGAGFLMPRTDAKLLNYERNDEFHVAGFGITTKVGVQFLFFKHLLVKLENKYGYINMPDVNLHKKGIAGNAKQAFFFTALDGMIGGRFALNKKRNSK